MARGRIASQTQSKLAMILFGEEGTGKSSLALQLSYFKRPDGKPFRILYIDNENGSIDDFIENVENDGIDTRNIYIVYTQSLGETEEYINKVKNNEDFMVLDEDGEETEEIVLDAEGNPFRADAVVVDGTSILKISTQQGLTEFSKKRNAVKAKAAGLVGDERLVRIEGAQMELKDFQTLNFKGQNLVLDLMSCGAHFIITARETEEKQSVKDKNGQITSISTGRKIPDGFKGMSYNVKTVIRMFKDEDGNFCADISKDRTGVHNNEIVEDLSLLDWQTVIDKTKDKKSFVVKNDLNKAVDIETKIYTKEIEKSGEISSADTKETEPTSITDSLIASINDKMKSFSVTNKNVAKKALEDKGLPASPKAIKAETNEETLKSVFEVINGI